MRRTGVAGGCRNRRWPGAAISGTLARALRSRMSDFLQTMAAAVRHEPPLTHVFVVGLRQASGAADAGRVRRDRGNQGSLARRRAILVPTMPIDAERRSLCGRRRRGDIGADRAQSLRRRARASGGSGCCRARHAGDAQGFPRRAGADPEASKAGASGVLLITTMLMTQSCAQCSTAPWSIGCSCCSSRLTRKTFGDVDARKRDRMRARDGQLLVGVNTRNLRTLEVDADRLQKLGAGFAGSPMRCRKRTAGRRRRRPRRRLGLLDGTGGHRLDAQR